MTANEPSRINIGIGGDAIRFLIAGCINTGLTVLIYQILLFWLSSGISYVLSWVCGIAFIATVYPSRVFISGRSSGTARLQLIASYVAIFLIGLTLMNLLENLGVVGRLAIFITVGINTVINFLASRFLLRGRGK